MGSVNKVLLVGNLGADPEMRRTPGGHVVANFRIATRDVWKDKNGQRQERTEWHKIVVWGSQGETCGKHLRKGRKVHVEGRLQTDEWQDQKSGLKRYKTEIVAERVTFLGKKPKGDDGSGADSADPAAENESAVDAAGE